MNNSASNFVLGGVLILASIGSFVFLHGSTSVFIGIIAAVAGAVFIIMGAQGPRHTPGKDLYLKSIEEQPTDADIWAQYNRDQGPENPYRNT